LNAIFKKLSSLGLPVKNVAALTTGNLIGYGATVLLLPALTRCFSPDKFGQFALLWSLTQICGLAGTLRLEKAFFLAQSPISKSNLARLAYLSSTIFCLSLSVLLSVSYEHFSALYSVLIWLPLTAWCQSAILIETFFGNSNNRYKRSSIARGIQGAGTSIIGLALFAMGSVEHGLIFALVITQISVIIGLLTTGEKIFSTLSRSQLSGLLPTLRQYQNFPKYTTPHEIWGAISTQATSLLIPSFFGTVLAGLFFIAQKCVMLPSVLIGNAISQVYFHELSKIRENRVTRERLFGKTLLTISSASALIFVPIYLVAPFLVQLILGSDWQEAGIYFRLLAPWAALQIVGTVLSQTPQVLNAQRPAMLIELANGLCRLSFLSLGYILDSAFTGIALYLASSILFTGGRLIWYSRLIKKPL